eukprot:SAG31_NODE_25896_length_452_cov_0.617564_1_plen_34_part_01
MERGREDTPTHMVISIVVYLELDAGGRIRLEKVP